MRAFIAAEMCTHIKECRDNLANLNSLSQAKILSTLTSVETRVAAIRAERQRMKADNVSAVLIEIDDLLLEVDTSLASWRIQYPDNSPILIDNGTHCFV
jgi:hypothetical protein